MSHIIKEAKSRPQDNRYKNSHEMIIQWYQLLVIFL
jgi:hypothetical protein